MNKFTTLEDKLLKEYWNKNPGLLFKEARVGGIIENRQRARRVDGILIPSKDKKIYFRNEFKSEKFKKEIRGEFIEIIEVKKELNRDVIGQVEVASYLIEKEFSPQKISAVIVCGKSHPNLEKYCNYKNIEIFVVEGLKEICNNLNSRKQSVKGKTKDLLENSPIFTNRDIKMIAENNSYADLFLHNLVKNGEAYRLTRGCYSWIEDPFLSVFCFRPAYLGLEFALSFYEVWDQETNPAIITPRKIRAGRREVLGTNANLYRIKRDYFFGIDYLKHDDFYLPISDIEKTVLDLIYFNVIPDKETWNKLLDKADKDKLLSYIKKYPQKTQVEMKRSAELR